jgi:cyclic lactone autoinducer peptide
MKRFNKKAIFGVLGAFLLAIASGGIGTACIGFYYEPEMPKACDK